MERTSQHKLSTTGEDPKHLPIKELRHMLEAYLDQREVSEIQKAYRFGAQAHSHQKRLSGEPYIHHPLEVARIMAELQLDATTIIAGILHDVIEDTGTTKTELAEIFGEQVAEVVDGVSKLSGLAFESREAKQARNFQKMMLAVAKDVRVILVKLADRLHNIRTIEYMPHNKQKSIARETLEIYAPLAHRVGIERLAIELEERAFAVLYPLRYQVIKNQVESLPGEKGLIFVNLTEKIRNCYQKAQLDCKVRGRKKHTYAIYKKMKEKKLSLTKIADVFAVRIVVNNPDSCYRALGIIHSLLKPVPGRFKDYIALPKSNGYQSLHTVLFGPKGIVIEVQIRTVEMDRIAETGIASHPLYKVKDGLHSAIKAKFQKFADLNKDTSDASGYMESLKADLVFDDVYVFTPNGEVIALPPKATALDFAFAIHTDIGLATLKVKINHHRQPLNTHLRSGQVVSVITGDAPYPRPEWLNFVVSAKARTSIRQHLKNMHRIEALQLGKRALNDALRKHYLSLDDIGKQRIDRVVELFEVKSLDDLCCEVGMANQVPQIIAAHLAVFGEVGQPLTLSLNQLLREQDSKDIVIHYPKCCYPLPGDDIVATATSERGIIIHRSACANAHTPQKQGNSLIHLQWPSDSQSNKDEYTCEIRAMTPHKRGALAKIAATIASFGSNIENIIWEEQQGDLAIILFTVSIKNTESLGKLIKKITKEVADTKVYRVGLKEDHF